MSVFDRLTIKNYCSSVLRSYLSGNTDEWSFKEVGDGNLNYVWIIKGGDKAIVLKQASDFLRIDPNWRLTVKRVYWERLALLEAYKRVPNRVPKLYYFDEVNAVNVMEYLEPHIILRKELIQGIRYPHVAEHIAEYLSETLFHTSDLFLPAEEKRKMVTNFIDNSLIHLTESVIFHEPYVTHKNNRWTNVDILNNQIKEIQNDNDLHLEVSLLKDKFMNYTQALIHGDLHTGSVMVTLEDTKIIDPEFAYFGPMGFDIGAIISNFWLSYFSQEGHISNTTERESYQQWLIEQSIRIWELFVGRFLHLWNTKQEGSCYILGDKKRIQQKYISDLLSDTLGYAGCKMIRRIIGIAHVLDLESISDIQLRAQCEVKVLKFAQIIIKQRSNVHSIHDAIKLLK